MSKIAREPTRAELRVLRAIRIYLEREEVSPSVQDLCDALGLRSKGTVAKQLAALKMMGLIASVNGRPRTLKIIKRNAA